MKSRIIKILSILIIGLFFGGAFPTIFTETAKADNIQLPFFDDFEDYNVGEYPDDNGWWQTMYSGISGYVSNEETSSGLKSFRLDSYPNWARTEYVNIDIPDKLEYEVDVFIEDSNKAAKVGFSIQRSNYNPKFNYVGFTKNGDIHFKGIDSTILQSYSKQTWYHIKVQLDYTTETADVYIDGNLKGNNLEIKPKEFYDPQWGDVTLNKFSLSSSNYPSGSHNVVYFDDIKISKIKNSDGIVNRKALLISCCDYEDGNEDLIAPKYDVKNMKYLLVDGFGFAEEDVIILREPSKDEIKNKLDDIKDATDNDDIKVFYYSGHGGHLRRSEYLDLTDINELYDYELNENFSDIDNLVGIFSTCYSGGLCHETDDTPDVDKQGNPKTFSGIIGSSKLIGMAVNSTEFHTESGFPWYATGFYDREFISAFTANRYLVKSYLPGDNERVSMEEAFNYAKDQMLVHHSDHSKIYDAWPSEEDNTDQFFLSENAVQDYLSFNLLCPANIHVFDTQGNHVGLTNNEEIDLQIPGVCYLGTGAEDSKYIIVFNPDSYDKLDFAVIGENKGFFSLECNNYNKDTRETETIIFNNIAIEKNSKATFSVTDGFTDMDVDYDGDGTIDDIISPTYYSNPVFVPKASFLSSVIDPQAHLKLNFDGSSSFDPDGQIVDYLWDFGDGTTGSGVIINHQYSSEGTYDVILTVTDDEGLSTKVLNTIIVGSAKSSVPIFSPLVMIIFVLMVSLIAIVQIRKKR